MQGFLDPEYPTRLKTDFRSVLDAVIAGLRPVQVYSYGSSIATASSSIGVLGRKEFYEDRDTRMDEAVALIGKDTALVHSHLIVGDGRRGSPATADGQYVNLREAAQVWIDRGGYFLVATSNAPFKTVESDPSGCRRAAQVGGGEQTCPIYLFAFIPHDDVMRVAGAVTDAFEHLFIWPAPPIPASALDFRSIDGPPLLDVNPIWEHAQDGTPIVRTSAPQRTLKPGILSFVVRDTTTAIGRAYRQLLDGDESRIRLESRSLAGGAGQPWGDADRGGLVKMASVRPVSLEVLSLGRSDALSLVRADVVPTGRPAWLSAVEAIDAKDVVRTYGIGRLFELFRQGAKLTPPALIARLYLVSN